MSNPIITVQDQFIAAFSAINGTGIYENDLKKIYQTTYIETPEHPSIAIIFSRNQETKMTDEAMTVGNLDLNFGIACFIAFDTDVDNSGICRKAQYSLFADIQRLIQSVNKLYVNANPSWIVTPKVPITMSAVEPWVEGGNTLCFGINGQILIRNLNPTLT